MRISLQIGITKKTKCFPYNSYFIYIREVFFLERSQPCTRIKFRERKKSDSTKAGQMLRIRIRFWSKNPMEETTLEVRTGFNCLRIIFSGML